MTEPSYIHALIQGLDDGVGTNYVSPYIVQRRIRKATPLSRSSHTRPLFNILQLFRIVMDQLVPHLDLSAIGVMARTCKSLRVMTSDGIFLRYILRLLPQSNCKETRRRFLIPSSMPLCRIARGVYSQSCSLLRAIETHGGMDGFRTAVAKRRIVTIKRRKMSHDRFLLVLVARKRRMTMLTDAMEVLGLPHSAHMSYPPSMLFVNNVPPIPLEIEEFRLSRIVECVCWCHYLRSYTNFHEACETRREVMGDYPGLERDVVEEYDRPEAWPWLI
jgi:hypothetical protein